MKQKTRRKHGKKTKRNAYEKGEQRKKWIDRQRRETTALKLNAKGNKSHIQKIDVGNLAPRH